MAKQPVAIDVVVAVAAVPVRDAASAAVVVRDDNDGGGVVAVHDVVHFADGALFPFKWWMLLFFDSSHHEMKRFRAVKRRLLLFLYKKLGLDFKVVFEEKKKFWNKN